MAERRPDLPKRKLTVTETKVIASGNTNGNDWTIYEVSAVNEQGAPVDLSLRSFYELEIGKPVEYEVEKNVHEKYGEQFMLKPPKRDLKASVDQLRDEVRALAARVAALEAGGNGQAPSSGPQSPGSRPLVQPATSSSPDDDLPF